MASEVLYNMNGNREAKSWVLREGGGGNTPCVPILLLRDHGKGRERPGAVWPSEGGEEKQGKRKWRGEIEREASGEGEGEGRRKGRRKR